MHLNIINYIGSKIFEDKFLIYLESASERSLVSTYKMLGPLKESIIRSYTKQILEGLEYLHLHDIVHHDLKGVKCTPELKWLNKVIRFWMRTSSQQPDGLH